MEGRSEIKKWIRELGGIIHYSIICGNTRLGAFRKRLNNKVYAYCDAITVDGNFELVISITDGCIVCSCARNFENASQRSEEILEAVLRIGTRLDWYGRFFLEKKNGNWPMKMELDEKLTSGFIEAYILSLDTAAYLRSIDHHFSELEKATIIGNHHALSDAEKLEALQRMKETTEDETLLMQGLILRRILHTR